MRNSWSVVKAPAQFRLEIGRVLAALGQITEIIAVARPLHEGVGQIEDRLEIAVPRNEARISAGYKTKVKSAPRLLMDPKSATPVSP
jgi:hypothetical protein